MPRPRVPLVNPFSAFDVARAVSRHISIPSVEARFRSLPAIELDHRFLDAYDNLIERAADAAGAYMLTLASTPEPAGPARARKHGALLKRRMLSCLLGALPKRLESVHRDLCSLRDGRYGDLVTELVALAARYEAHGPAITKAKAYEASDAAEAMALAAELQEARLRVLMRRDANICVRWAEGFAALRAAHDEICAAGRWLDRNTNDPSKHYPSLFAQGDATWREAVEWRASMPLRTVGRPTRRGRR